MKLRNLIYFFEIEKCGNMSKAAEKLYVSQPALSKGMNELEKELGCQLFIRKASNIVLTEEGKRCLEYSKKIISLCNELPEYIKQKETKSLKVGYVIVGYLEYLLNIINDKDELKDISIIPIYGTTNEIVKKLEDNELDLAILPCLEIEKTKNIRHQIINKNKVHALVNKNHPLFSKDYITIDDLRKNKIIIWSKKNHHRFYKSYLKLLLKNGIDENNIIPEANVMGDMIALMNINHAIGLAGPITSSLPQKEYRTIPIVDLDEELLTCIEWNENNDNSAIYKLLREL